jgi:dTDP-glucose 4,6-dehydratase
VKKKILITGAAGFIGSNFLKRICLNENVKGEYDFVIIDALTYAGHFPTIKDDIDRFAHLSFEMIDIRDNNKIKELFSRNSFDGIINFAAESHVDRSIENPNIFVETNCIGTLNLLNNALVCSRENSDFKYLQVSTDEVYGALNFSDPAFTEDTPLAPNSPYSASKTGADLLVRSFNETYGLKTIITRCSNNYGPYQFPEKLIPLMISNAINDKKLPVYGKGENIRDWIYVDDHNDGIWAAYTKGKAGEIYNFGGNAEMKNIDLVKLLIKSLNKSEDLITFVTDRLGHDLRYAINFEKAKKELNWGPKVSFEDGINRTVEWYRSNEAWLNSVKAKNI